MNNSPMLGLRTLGQRVPDLDAAKAWYTQAFMVEPYFDEPFYVGYNIGGYELGLNPDGYQAESKSANTIVYWGVQDIALQFNRLINLGAVEVEPPQNVGVEIMVATVADPWGNPIGLIYNPEFKLE